VPSLLISVKYLRLVKSQIVVLTMNGLRRNDDAMKNYSWYQKKLPQL